MKTSNIARGLRNNNPLNIEDKPWNRWQGLVNNPKEKRFCTFDTRAHGLRAALIIIKNKIKRGCNTPKKIISEWAPVSENNTKNYIQFVVNMAEIDRDQILNFEDKETICYFAQAMATMECGVILSIAEFREAYDMV